MRIMIKPVPAGLLFCLYGVLQGAFTSMDKGAFEFRSAQGWGMIGLAVVSFIVLVLAFLFLLVTMVNKSRVLLLTGYLLSSGVFTWRAVLGFIESGFNFPAPWISLGIATICGLSFWYEGLENNHGNKVGEEV